MTAVAQPLSQLQLDVSRPSQIDIEIASEQPTPSSDSGVIMSSEAATPESIPIKVAEELASNGSATLITQSVTASAGPRNGKVTNGPDELAPADSMRVWDRDHAVKLRLADTGHLSHTPVSVITCFQNTVHRVPDRMALAVKRKGAWVKWTYQQYYVDTQRLAKAFIKIGLRKNHGVGILGFNAPEWFISNLAAMYAGGLSVGIYTTNTPESCQYIAENSMCDVIIVENDQQLQKIIKVRDSLPCLKAIVQYSGELKGQHEDVYTWDQFIELGRDVPDQAIRDIVKTLAPNKCASLIYTSGTTGKPKGVMLSHDNYTWTANQATKMAGLKFGEDSMVSYLPLSHVAAQLFDIYISMSTGGSVWFAQPDALRGTLSDTLKEVRPTAFFGVPRVYEKIQEKMQQVGKSVTGLKRTIATWAKGVGLRGNMATMNGGALPFGWGIANAVVFKKIHAALGLDQSKFFFSGAAPMTRETMEYFMSLNMPIMEIYGMSESTGPHTFSFPWQYRISSVGQDMPGATTRLEDPDKDGNGEICMSGRHIFMGYVGEEEKTKDCLLEDGWLHTGDVGKKVDGYLFITGRIKELLITAGGENVAPVPIEDIVKEELPCVSNCMLIGDKRKFLAILLTIKSEVDGESMVPTDAFSHVSLDWARSVDSPVTTVTQLLQSKDEPFLKAIQAGIDRANNRSVSRAQKIQKWSVLPRDFSIPGEELGPTMKLKRPVVHKMYKNTIDAFYAGS